LAAADVLMLAFNLDEVFSFACPEDTATKVNRASAVKQTSSLTTRFLILPPFGLNHLHSRRQPCGSRILYLPRLNGLIEKEL